MDKQFLSFTSILLFLLAIAFGLHLFLLQNAGKELFENLILTAYLLNAFITILLYLILTRLPESLKGNMGFIFMGGSLLKFLLFFLIFYPEYQVDKEMDKFEFLAFFVPYSLSLIWETYSLVRRLNKA